MGKWMVPLAFLLFLLTACRCFRFTKQNYNGTIYENSRGKTYVNPEQKMGIERGRQSAEVRYKIVGGDRDKFFKAEDKEVGDFVFLMIRTRTGTTDVLNRERKDKYVLHIRATVVKKNGKVGENQDLEATVYVAVLDTNDLNPLFYPTQYEEVVAEDVPLHKSILKVNAEDADLGINGEIYYSFKEKTEQFSIHPTSGVVTLTRHLRYSEKSFHKMTVVAKDRGGGKPSFGVIKIHVKQVNLFGPEIYVHRMPSVVERSNMDVYAIVRVLDQDEGVHGEISSLEIVDGDPDGSFRVRNIKHDLLTGYEYNIEVLRLLDRESSPKGYNLTLKAIDKGSPPRYTYKSLSLLLTDINDNAPVFEKNFYEVDVSENTPLNSPILRIKVADADLGLNAATYMEILKGNGEGKFTINPDTGMLYTAEWLDAEELPFYTLTVAATDKASSGSRKQTTTTIKINIIDANDNDPVFESSEVTVSIVENEPAGTSVTTIKATDADSGENSYISYSIANLKPVPFEIDHFSGLVRTTQVLDFESMKREYILKIRASDWGLPYRRQTEMQLKIIVKDVNDNRPQFEKVDCIGHIPRYTFPGSELLVLSAIDFDTGNIISYRINSGNDDECFLLDSTSGILRLVCDPSDIKETQRNISVTATDHTHFADPATVYIKFVSTKKNAGLEPKNWFQCKDTGVTRRLTEVIASAEKMNMNKEEFAMMPSRYGQNYHSPEFIDFPVQVRTNESVPIGTVLIKIQARDRDLGYNGKLVYGIAGGDPDSVFRLDPETGELKVIGYLDREREEEYFLNVTVFDLGRPKKNTSRFLPVTVTDVNDNPPKFERPVTSFRVTENALNGTAIFTFNATDSDTGENAEIEFSLVTDFETFGVEPKTGVLYVSGKLDREERDSYELIVRAVDCAGTHSRDVLYSEALVKIYVDDVNDNPPLFSSDHYKVKIPEDLPVGAVVAIVEARDEDLGEGGVISYQLFDETKSFEIDTVTGTVRTTKPLDYETRQSYSITVSAADRGVPSLSSETVLEVDIVDVNENRYPPVFGDIVIGVEVNESEPSGTLVTTVKALDADPPGDDSKITYSIVSGDGMGVFHIDNKGQITTLRVLDAESTSAYWINVVAQDSGLFPLHATLQVYIEVKDKNDETPLTTEPVYWVSVEEESEEPTGLIQVTAFDKDRDTPHLSFKITAGNPQSFFNINSSSGLITTTARKLDREQQHEHTIEVTVTDNGIPPLSSTTRVIVEVKDINDHAPNFDQPIYHVTIPENKHLNAIMPKIESSSEEVLEFDNLQDLESWESFPNNASSSYQLLRVLAYDQDAGENGTVEYSLKSGKMKGRFSIHPTLGIISTEQPLYSGQQINLLVLASDKGIPRRNSTARVSIKVLPLSVTSMHSPVIKQLEKYIQLTEADPVGYLVMVVQATDPDGDPLWYNITDGDAEYHFIIGRDKGNVQLAKKLNREKQDYYNLTIGVTDGIHTAYTQLYIAVLDVNEYRPTISKQTYSVSIPESTKVGSRILQLEAFDEDIDSKIVYNIHNSKDKQSLQSFKIDYETGAVYIAGPLDRETISQHILTVVVRDSGTPAKSSFARVVIDITDTNDHQPEFGVDKIERRIYSTIAIGTNVVNVLAVDRDHGENGTVKYSIISGNIGGIFSIDPALGELSVVRELDSSSPVEYSLIIKAIDCGVEPLYSTIPVHILVLTPGNSPPKFLQSDLSGEVFENSPAGTVVTQIKTSGWGLIFEISSGNTGFAFKINPTTGVVITNKILDREEHNFYNLSICTINMAGEKSYCTLNIHILDRNDNAPEFLSTMMYAWILESAPVGSLIMDKEGKPLVATAVDKDLHANALLDYHFVNRKHASMFHIDSTTGAIRTVVCLDHEKIKNIVVTLTVTDKGKPQLKSEKTATVNIAVVDVNDCPPVFTEQSYNATVLLPTYDNVFVIQINATDADSPNLTTLTYSITKGNSHGIYIIDKNAGIIVIKNREKGQSTAPHTLTVSVSDGKFHSEALINVNWVRIKPSSLSFQKDHYEGAVLENSSQIINVVILSVRGVHLNELITFSILNPMQEFTIGKTSGAIKTTGVPLDRETKELYTLIVQAISEEPLAVSQNDIQRIARVEVNITVLDVNDNCPIIVSSEYNAVVSMTARKHHVVTRIIAIDADKGENGEIRYELEKGPAEIFRVCQKSGNISLKQLLPRNQKVHSLTVAAHDNGIPPCRNRVDVYITVLDQQSPVFEYQLYHSTISEDVSLHSPIPLTIRAESPLNNDIMYTISKGNEFEEFQTDFNIGSTRSSNLCIVTVEDMLDYESQHEYYLTIRATDTITGKYSEVPLHLAITDANDNPPVFDLSYYNVSVLETLPIGNLVLQISAQDNDTGLNSNVQYSLDQDNIDSSFFHIKANDGGIYLKKILDYETKRVHHLVARAFDTGVPVLSSTVHIFINVIDVLDTAPQLEGPFLAKLYVNAKRGQFVSHIRALHNTKTLLSYSLLSANHEFHLDKITGILTVANPKNLTVSTYIVNISVSDGVYTSFSRVKIEVLSANQNAPHFEKPLYEIGVKENMDAGTLVIKVSAVDEDYGTFGAINYTINSDTLSAIFYINSSTGEVKTKAPLDREIVPFYEVPITAMDGGGKTGFSTILVTVIDVNDNEPHFLTESYTVSIPSSLKQSTAVTKVHAEDKDEGMSGILKYSMYYLDDTEIPNIFFIDENSGELSTKISLNEHENKVYEWFIQATDGGIPPLHVEVPITVYIVSPADQVPIFEKEENTLFVSETVDIGHVITSAKLTKDMSVTFSLRGQTSNKFNVDQHGKITLSSPLDRELIATHKLTVLCETVTMPPISASRQITLHVLDSNDNRPAFHSKVYRTAVSEDTPPGTSIVKVTADDKDEGNNGEVHYWLEDSIGLFSLDRATGWLSTTATLDREKKPEYSISVFASDNGNPVLVDKATISIFVVDVNDNPPIFQQDLWNISVPEDISTGSLLLTLVTTDADNTAEPLKYYITSGDDNSDFEIKSSGQLFLLKQLDREQKYQYNLSIVASDGRFTAFTRIIINIIDINDELPQCLQHLYNIQLPEDASIGTYVTTVKAYDPDVDPKLIFKLKGKYSDYFLIDEMSGNIKTRRVLDREKISELSLVIDIEDSEKNVAACSSTVIVTILDINDNAPQFGSSNLTSSILENAPVGSIVTKVRATDADIGMNSKITYIMKDSSNGHFIIMAKTGVILLSKPLDREDQDNYNLVVEATDEGTPQLTTSASIHISVLDVNDNPPIFLKNSYSSEFYENAPAQTVVLKVEASSIDIGKNAEIIYKIVRGNEDGTFHLDNMSGILSLSQELDYEHVKDYFLVIEATDKGEPPLSSQAFINLTVLDFNDNAPSFTQSAYSVSIPEDTPVGNTIIQVMATDMDSGKNGQVKYSIEKGDVHQQFSINPNNGCITVLRPLDREMIPTYSLLIKGIDSGEPLLSNITRVNIDLLDVNDNPPLFTQSNYSAIVQEGKVAGWPVLQLSVSDADSDPNGGPYTFDIRGGNGADLFRIGSDGTLRTVTRLTHRVRQSYSLNIRVFDSGTPPLYSDTIVSLKVIEESQYPPAITPMDITVMSYEDRFKGGYLGRVHATDLDHYDTLIFSVASDTDFFSVDERTGHLQASALDSGFYKVNISVSDGKFMSFALINVHVRPIWADMLLSSFSIRLKNVVPEHFILSGRKSMMRLLKSALKAEVLLISLQPVNKDLDLLIEIKGGFEIDNLNQALSHVGLPSVKLNCHCLNEGICQQRLSILPDQIITTPTEVNSFIAPAHFHELYCACPPAYTGEKCDLNLEEACDCPPPMVCSHLGSESTQLTCTSPPPVAPLCALNHTCHSSNQQTSSAESISYDYIVIILSTVVTTFLLLVAAGALVYKCMKKRRPHTEEKENPVLHAEPKCTSKNINLQATKRAVRPTSCSGEAVYAPIPLNNLDSARSYGSAGDELESLPSHYVRNLNRNTDPALKITNDLKGVGDNSLRSHGGQNGEEETRLMHGYHWDYSDYTSEFRYNPNHSVLANITEVPGSENESSSLHSNESNSDKPLGQTSESLLRYSLSGNEVSPYGFPSHSDLSTTLCDIEDPGTIS